MRGIAVNCYGVIDAGVAELADALDSKSSVRKDVGVQVPPPVLFGSKDLRRFSASKNGPPKYRVLQECYIFSWASSEGVFFTASSGGKLGSFSTAIGRTLAAALRAGLVLM
jgi:hypothetical protein